MTECRIMALGLEHWPPAGPGWRRVDPPEAGAQAGLMGADVLVLADDSAAGPELIDRLALPLVVAVNGGDGGPWLDRADAWLLPDDDERVVADVLRALARPALVGVAETSATARHISALSSEAQRIADALARLAAQADDVEPTPITAALVRRLIRLRRDRDRHFPAEIFADPAWDMLLDLTAARLEQMDVPVSSLCVASAVPTTTALRWIRSLIEAGLLVRRTDPIDARRAFITLSDQAHQAMLGWLRRFAAAFSLR